ncbi:S-adenosyl-L-methionine-dependent methyltransferase [Gamsiella multidivaricata]|uniref:S-adenosyl-L-methionine-dependent methyltransferase n=1 Tax=Gamsiella multidivaricata TaxID=101098 RepID=UPI00221F9304|nr:S-adenosyl-L-methionine-dependent methyltransferase [Gamsiella multidivaricata]KAG0364020.1 hypothetical protein BGZ54_007915 [Gamsiella multidivaricata]KAI7827160.1 S-adenosyl-L-methionine-dependent methyltransferase [Gamsiella multidivaricata]
MSDIQALNNDHFNKTAKDYDAYPQAEEMTQRAAEVIIREFTASTSEEHVKNASVLEFGCGTGLCAFKVAPSVQRLLGVDASQGMIDHLNYKLNTNAANVSIRDKIKTVQHLVKLDSPLPEPELSQYLSGPDAGFNMVYSSYVLHHIEDLQGTVDVLAKKLLKKDGWLIILDFMGSHHHHGQHDKAEDYAHQHGEHHHHHHHQQQHQHGEHNKGEKKMEEHVHEFFLGADGKASEMVPHKAGFTLEGFAEIFKKAGLVDVEAKHVFGMNHTRNEKQVWIDMLVVIGRRA